MGIYEQHMINGMALVGSNIDHAQEMTIYNICSANHASAWRSTCPFSFFI